MPSQEPTDAQAAPKVIIVGAGPVGLIIALRLARVGIRSDVFEKEAVLNTAPRALGYYGGSLISLARAGVLDKVKAAGFTASGVCWRKAVTGSAGGSGAIGDVIARVQFPTGDPGSPLGADACVCLMQSQLTALLYQETQETGLVNVAFNMELTSINDKEDSVIATFKNRDADTYETREAAFLVGADGGKSTTRSLLGIQLMGHSWPERLVAIDALYELETDPKWPISFIVDPIHFGLMAPLEPWKVGQKTLYRVTAAVGMTDQRPDEELCSTQSVRHILERTLPGAQSQEAEIKRAATYRIHQLCASTFRKGRCALAGDAAHLKNPFGAMGLTTGLLDAEALADTLELILLEGKPQELLGLYSEERQRAFQFFTSPISTQLKLLAASDPERMTEHWLIRSLLSPDSDAMEKYGPMLFEVWRTDIRALLAKNEGSLA